MLKQTKMKKYFAILMAVLCLVTFSVTDADAKKRSTRQRTQSTSTQSNYTADLLGCANGECGGFEVYLVLNGQSGKVEIGGYTHRATVVSCKGNKLKVKFDMNGDEGYLEGRIKVQNGRIIKYTGKYYYKSWPSNKLHFELTNNY